MSLHAELITIDLGDIWVTKDNDLGMKKDGTFLEAFPERKYMDENLKKGDCFWDIGAHVGFFSIYASQLGAGFIQAYEAHPDNYDLLNQNFLMHRIKGSPWWCAVGDRIGDIDLYESINNTGDNMVGHGGPTHTLASSVPMSTLDSVIALSFNPPNFIKIDVQGYEYKVLKGAQSVIKRHSPIIMMEYSPWHLQAQGEAPHEFLDYLGTLPYNLLCNSDPYDLPSPQYTTLYLEPR